MTEEITFIELDLKLPDHHLELYKAEEIIIKLNFSFTTIRQKQK